MESFVCRVKARTEERPAMAIPIAVCVLALLFLTWFLVAICRDVQSSHNHIVGYLLTYEPNTKSQVVAVPSCCKIRFSPVVILRRRRGADCSSTLTVEIASQTSESQRAPRGSESGSGPPFQEQRSHRERIHRLARGNRRFCTPAEPSR